MFVCLKTFCVRICWVRIDQRVEYEPTESGYETFMGTKRLVSDSTWVDNRGGDSGDKL